MRSSGHVVDELRRCINTLSALTDDSVARGYLDVSFVALEDSPTENGYLGPGTVATTIGTELLAAEQLLAELAGDDAVDSGDLITCRVALREAADHWSGKSRDRRR